MIHFIQHCLRKLSGSSSNQLIYIYIRMLNFSNQYKWSHRETHVQMTEMTYTYHEPGHICFVPEHTNYIWCKHIWNKLSTAIRSCISVANFKCTYMREMCH